MHAWSQRMMGWVAILAIALHTVLWGFGGMPNAAAAAVDPFSVICHSGGGSAQDDGASGAPASRPSAACDHCSLCSTVAAPPLTDASAQIRLVPLRLSQQSIRAGGILPSGIALSPKLAQGPPHEM